MTLHAVAPVHQHRRFGILRRYPITATAMVMSLIRVVTATMLNPQALDNIFMDDAFYYFGIAQHLAAGMGSTFGGVDMTNGYHPLWLLITWALFSVTSGRSALIAVVVVQCIVVIATAASMDRIRHRAAAHEAGFVVGALLSMLFIAALGTGIAVSGMETGLVVLFLTLIGELWQRTNGFASTSGAWGPFWLLGGLSAATVLSRLDSGVVIGVLYIAIAVASWRRHDNPTLVRLVTTASLPAIILGGYLATNQILFGSAMPVSGVAKSMGATGNWSSFVDYLLGPGMLGKPTGLGALSLVLAAVAVFARGVPAAVRTAGMYGALLALSGGFLGLFYAVASSWGLWPWYLYSAPLSLAFTVPALVTIIRLPERGARALAILAAIGLIAATGLWAALSTSGSRGQPWVTQAATVATLVDTLPPGTVAMGDRAGAFGFHLHRPLVQLEGLVESPAYLQALREGKVGAYLNARGVTWYVRQDADPGKVIPGVPAGCRGFTEPAMGNGPKASIVVCDKDLVAQVQLSDGTSYRVWRYRPELNR